MALTRLALGVCELGSGAPQRELCREPQHMPQLVWDVNEILDGGAVLALQFD